MIHTPHIDWFAISTVLVLLGGSFIALLSAVLVPSAWRRTVSVLVAAVTTTGATVTSVWLYVDSASGHRVIANSFYRDRWTALTQIILCATTLATVLVGAERVRQHESEFFALLLASAAGMTFFVGSANLMVMFLSLEWFSIALYVLCAIDYDLEGSLEAGLKYLVVGSFG
jgi:NADH-quinone oxidoreductase subunit N